MPKRYTQEICSWKTDPETDRSRRERKPIVNYVDVKRLSPKVEAWILIVFGIVLGTVFTFGIRYWKAPVEKSEAVSIEATFDSYREVKKGGEIIVRFKDYEQLSIAGECNNSDVTDKLSAVRPVDKLTVRYNPNGKIILELTDGTTEILQFDDSAKKLNRATRAFAVLGGFMYFAAIHGAFKLIRKKV